MPSDTPNLSGRRKLRSLIVQLDPQCDFGQVTLSDVVQHSLERAKKRLVEPDAVFVPTANAALLIQLCMVGDLKKREALLAVWESIPEATRMGDMGEEVMPGVLGGGQIYEYVTLQVAGGKRYEIANLDAVPWLHARGFSLPAKKAEMVVDQLLGGRWPHPELLRPNLLSLAQSATAFWKKVAFSTNKPGLGAALTGRLVDTLEIAPEFIEAALVKCATGGWAPQGLELASIQDSFALLAERGLLDMDRLAEKIQGATHERLILSSLAGARAHTQARALDRFTPVPAGQGGRSGPRL